MSVYRKVIAVLCFGALLGLTACAGDSTPEDATQSAAEKVEGAVSELAELSTEKVRELAEIAAAIEKEPGRIQEILEEKGITKEKFDEMMKTVSESPALKEAFDAAKKAFD
jgi:maltose-binding protein MalE